MGAIITGIFICFILFLGIQAAIHKYRQQEKLNGTLANALIENGHVLKNEAFQKQIGNTSMEVRLLASNNLFHLNSVEVRAKLENKIKVERFEEKLGNSKIQLRYDKELWLNHNYLIFPLSINKVIEMESELAIACAKLNTQG